MNAEKTLREAYAEWHRLAEAGGRAIRRRDWNFLLDCQQVVQNLQPVITRLLPAARAEWKQAGGGGGVREKETQAIVLGLTRLGEHTRSQLAAARAAARAEREQLDRAG